MKKDKFISFRVSEEEMLRLEDLAGPMKVPQFLLSTAFHVKRATGKTQEYPGWEIAERGRRDLGILIAHPSHGKGVMLYPEDAEYARFMAM